MHGRGKPIWEAKKRWQKVGVGWQEESEEIETARKVHFFKSFREFGCKRKMTDKDTEGNEGSGEGLFVFNWMYLSMIKN